MVYCGGGEAKWTDPSKSDTISISPSEENTVLNRLNLRSAHRRIAAREKHQLQAKDKTIKSLIREAFSFSKAIYLMIGVALGFAVNALSIPKNILEFKTHYEDAKRFIEQKIYHPADWSGIFDTFPEGIVDMNDLGIFSPGDAALEIEAVDGNILDGRIWWDKSCESGTPYTGVLITGHIDFGGSKAHVEVYDFIGGHRIQFFEGKLMNDGLIMEFTDFPTQTGLNGSRIVKNPEPAVIENWNGMYCDWFLKAVNLKNNQTP